MEALSSLGEDKHPGFLGYFCEGIEQAPGRLAAGNKFLVARVAPFFDDVRELLRGGSADVQGANGDIVNLGIYQFLCLVGLIAGVHVHPFFGELANGATGEDGEITHDIGGVLTGDADFAREREVVAHEHARTNHQTSRETFVMRVAEAQDVSVVFANSLAVGDLKKGEVALSVPSEGVLLGDDAHVHLGEGTGNLIVESAVGNRAPAVYRFRGADLGDLIESCLSGTSVKTKV